MAEDNKAIARRVLDCFNTGDTSALDEVVAPDAVDHDTQNPNRDIPGPEGFKKTIEMYRGAFPDLEIRVEDQIAEGDKVVTRWEATGTHEGDLPDLPATGKRSTVTGMGIDRFENGMIVEVWGNWDTLGMLEQLGAAPSRERATA